jgi:branched-chain amino acid aminotransferase
MQIYIDGYYDRESAKVRTSTTGSMATGSRRSAYNCRIFRHLAHLERPTTPRALALTIRCASRRWGGRRHRAATSARTPIRLIVACGVGELGTLLPDAERHQLRQRCACSARALPAASHRSACQVSHEAIDPRIKSLNYLKNILAKTTRSRPRTRRSCATPRVSRERTADNLFVVRAASPTPSLQDGALGGIIRGVVLEPAAEARILAAEAR